ADRPSFPAFDRDLKGERKSRVEHLAGNDVGEVLEVDEVLPLLDVVDDDGVGKDADDETALQVPPEVEVDGSIEHVPFAHLQDVVHGEVFQDVELQLLHPDDRDLGYSGGDRGLVDE